MNDLLHHSEVCSVRAKRHDDSEKILSSPLFFFIITYLGASFSVHLKADTKVSNMVEILCKGCLNIKGHINYCGLWIRGFFFGK